LLLDPSAPSPDCCVLCDLHLLYLFQPQIEEHRAELRAPRLLHRTDVSCHGPSLAHACYVRSVHRIATQDCSSHAIRHRLEPSGSGKYVAPIISRQRQSERSDRKGVCHWPEPQRAHVNSSDLKASVTAHRIRFTPPGLRSGSGPRSGTPTPSEAISCRLAISLSDIPAAVPMQESACSLPNHHHLRQTPFTYQTPIDHCASLPHTGERCSARSHTVAARSLSRRCVPRPDAARMSIVPGVATLALLVLWRTRANIIVRRLWSLSSLRAIHLHINIHCAQTGDPTRVHGSHTHHCLLRTTVYFYSLMISRLATVARVAGSSFFDALRRSTSSPPPRFGDAAWYSIWPIRTDLCLRYQYPPTQHDADAVQPLRQSQPVIATRGALLVAIDPVRPQRKSTRAAYLAYALRRLASAAYSILFYARHAFLIDPALALCPDVLSS